MTTLTLPTMRIAPAWRVPAFVLLACIALLLLSYRGTAMTMVGIWWRSETFAHAFVVPPIVLWLIWRKRGELARLNPRPVPWMALPLAMLAAIWWLGDLVAVNAVTQLTLTAMLVALVPTLLGWQVARSLMFPLGFLFFAVPIGEFMTPTLMHYTADFTVAALRLTGIPIYREGQHFIIPSGSWSVIDECSGIRYLMASFMVGTLFAYLNYHSLKRRLVFMAVSIVTPIVANWLRAYMIVMLAHVSGNKLATGVDHILYGWVFFGIVIMGMFFIGARWAQNVPQTVHGSTPASGPAHQDQQPALHLTLLAAALAVLAVQLPRLHQSTQTAEGRPPTVELPDRLAAPWHADGQDLSTWRPIFVGASVEAQRTYVSPQGRVAVYVAYYRHQSETSKLVSSVNVMVPMRGSEWNHLTSGTIAAPAASGNLRWRTAELVANVDSLRRERQRLRAWHLYWIDDSLASTEVQAKLLQLWQRVKGGPDDGAAIFLTTSASSPDEEDRVLTEFVSANFGMLRRVLVDTSRAR